MLQQLLSYAAACLLSVTAIPALAGDPVYPAAAIPAALKENAHLVKRLEEYSFNIHNLRDARLVKHYVITVLDEQGAGDAAMQEWYNKQQEIKSVTGTLYDAEGKQLKRVKQADIKDLSAVDEASLITDTRIKHHRFYHNVYPYTVEYEIEMRYNCTSYFPVWQPQDDIDCTVEQSRLVVTVPADYTLRYSSYLYNGEPLATTGKDTKTYTWEVKNIQALRKEVNPDEFYRRTPSVFLAPSSFEVDRYKGRMDTWQDFGAFIYQLNEGRDVLPEGIRQQVHQLTDGLHNRKEKISVLYKYLQQNYRYIGIQLGIGGWQTFDAATVAAKGYGDCKALSNYMMAMLKEAGIPSNYALVKAGENSNTLRENFSSPQFNHVILCVPDVSDTTWLECTSNTMAPGYLGAFTANRPVLFIDAQNSRLLHTPTYGIDSNQQLRHINAVVDSAGHITINSRTTRTGLQQDHLHMRLHALSREKQLELLRENLDLSSYDIAGYQCRESGTAIPAIEEEIRIQGHHYATVTGKRMFLMPDILNHEIPRLEEEEARKSAIKFDYAYRDIDTVNITLPSGYKPESIPAPVTLKSKFGTYSATIDIRESTVNYIRRMELVAGTFPATDFPDLVKFFNTIYSADRSKLVLVK